MLDGQPLPGATVLFMPEDGSGRAATGLTDSEGNFLLTTYKDNDGAVSGNYRVLVSKSEAIEPPPAHLKPGDEKSVTDHYRSLKSRKNRKSNVPRLYSREASTPLGCTVPPADKVVFELSSKEGK
ncbi:MAG TPA: carboxypeptidase-like regulatory domain-containing protein [Gemmataceae bacterium]|nr:carboxypeptidase-like regulatory domain-containing protein [Gemmataceae bacterium]